jgi:hypothetical protein
MPTPKAVATDLSATVVIAGSFGGFKSTLIFGDVFAIYGYPPACVQESQTTRCGCGVTFSYVATSIQYMIAFSP